MGNDDCGQMPAWYMFSVLGFYPVNLTGGQYIFEAPQIEETIVHYIQW
ncbi:glycoside hydrolase family 92 protein [Flavivirga amylovorans]|uniref:Glycoside hydrolase family 92 protein n=1 Tax=Flavivirga amylovorans TaxID=870486 RepID=A0ABT8WYU3_9FLAO|nr:glycoside hydrolase domain-containing protein [Flavivirga amylovorans]MDO5986849.1 glycoside hydrolase family 92 protein [Flavivirga amylovorans]